MESVMPGKEMIDLGKVAQEHLGEDGSHSASPRREFVRRAEILFR